jgi:uncharacterized protein YjbJ (UPF0337 family)
VIKKKEINMTLLRQTRNVLITIGLVLLIAMATTFSFASGESWATTSLTQSINQLQPPIAMMNKTKAIVKTAEGKAQEELGNMTGDLKNQAAGKAKQLEGKTQEAILDSIDNPGYQPGGNMRKQSRKAVKDLETDVRDEFDQKSGS